MENNTDKYEISSLLSSVASLISLSSVSSGSPVPSESSAVSASSSSESSEGSVSSSAPSEASSEASAPSEASASSFEALSSFSPSKVDLHLHSNFSDGSDSPRQLIQNIVKAGIEVFAVTDHDTLKGVDLVRDLAEEYNRDPEKFMSGAVDDRADVNGKEQKQLISINGVEFSCEDEKGRYHILGYGFDPAAEAINKAADHTHELRMEKFHSRLDFLKEEFGFVFKEEDIKALEAQGNPARPHVGNLMVKYGYAESKDDAIRNYINKKHFASLHIKPQEAIDAIIESGGIPVLAHPNFGDGSQYISGREVEERIAYLLDMGIRGIEVYYSRTSQEDMEQLLMLAEKHRLIVTCGSDYHGSNKTVRIGQTNVPNVSG